MPKEPDPKKPEKEEEPVVPEPTPPEEPEVPIEEPEEEPAPTEEEPEEEPEPKPPSRRESLRVADLLNKMKESKQTPEAKPTETLDYEKALDADPELIKKLQEDRDKSNQEMYQQGIAQANSIRFHTRLEIDAPRIEAKYPQLDKSNDKFNPVLANAINTMFLSSAGYDPKTDTAQNPDLRYGDYVESIFELADEVAGEKVSRTTENITKQAAQAGIRPSSGTGKRLNLNQTPNQMSDEELKAKIDQDFKALGLA